MPGGKRLLLVLASFLKIDILLYLYTNMCTLYANVIYWNVCTIIFDLKPRKKMLFNCLRNVHVSEYLDISSWKQMI